MPEQAPDAGPSTDGGRGPSIACGVAAADIAHLQPSEIRQWVSDLLTAGHDALAQAVGDAALTRHPSEPEVLTCAVLLAQARQDWLAADDLLNRWVSVHGNAMPASAWHQWAQVLLQLGDPRAALNAAVEGGRLNPGHTGLAESRGTIERRWRQHQLMHSPAHRH